MARPPRDATDEARALAGAWFRASMENDDDWFAENVAPEFRYQMSDGGIETIDVLVPFAHQITNKRYEVLDVVGHRYGDVLVVYGTYSGRGTLPPGSSSEAHAAAYARGLEARFTHVWVDDESGTPRIVHMQTTTIAA